MKFLISPCLSRLLVLLCFTQSACEGRPSREQDNEAIPHSGWTTDYDKGIATAKSERRLVLLNFTGSDWCAPCMAIDREIFSKPEFKEYAEQHLVLVEIDFPVGKRQAPRLREQNERLREQFGVFGFPTIIVLSPDGKKLGDLVGAVEVGLEGFIAALEKLRKS